MQLHPGGERDDRVGNHRWQPPIDERILPVFAPAGDNVGPGTRRLDHRRDVFGIVLAVAIGRHDEGSAGVLEAGSERRGLTEVAAEADHPNARVLRLDRAQQREGIVLTSVVDHDDLERPAVAFQRRYQLAVELTDVGRLVPHRYDDRDLRTHVIEGW